MFAKIRNSKDLDSITGLLLGITLGLLSTRILLSSLRNSRRKI
jgi:hypothetical protein